MTDFLPLFPLQLVAFPGENLNLHIFEPRYKQLIREANQNRTTFGIPAYLDKKVMLYATEMKVIDVVKTYDSGEMDIKTKGVGIVKISEFYKNVPNKLYSGGDIKRLEFKSGDFDPVLNQVIVEQVQTLFGILKIKKDIPKNKLNFSLYELAHHVGFNKDQEYEFLTILDRGERQLYMKNHLDRMIPIVEEAERLRKRVEMNGHFKGEIPPSF